MKHPDPNLPMPLYVKTDSEMPWPADEAAFHVLGSNGLFICRNTPFFTSSVRVDRFPSGLADHRGFCRLNVPKLPRRLFELVVGFFDRVATACHGEAAVLLAWDRPAGRYRLVVPPQVSIVSRSRSGEQYPLSVKYDTPELPSEWILVGDIHSHVYENAYASSVDRADETHRPGLHIVIGRLDKDPPELHIAFVVDGERFDVNRDMVIEGYRRRRRGVPRGWLAQVKVRVYQSQPSESSTTRSDGWSRYP